MTTTVMPAPARAPYHIVLHGVSFRLYEMLLEAVGEQRIYMTYDSGNLELMSPLPKHERVKTLIGRFIETLSLELNIPICGLGSTTFKREDLEKGLEPDECYYVQHEAQMRAKDEIDLLHDPPPDLVAEVDVTHREISKESIYAAMGVPEMWRYDLRRLRFFKLNEQGRYEPCAKSLAFPLLAPADIEPFLEKRATSDDTSLLKNFAQWVREHLTQP